MVQLYGSPEMLTSVYTDAHLRLCDSRVIALMAKWSGVALPFVTGSGLTARMLSKPLPTGIRIAMIGGNARQRAWLAETQPDATILCHEPPMGLRTNLAARVDAAAFVEEAQADIILITVGAPQSEMIASLIHTRGVARGVALCVGASLEFITGEKRRAPAWVQALAMEWAFRLLSEPRRLAHRYLVDGPRVFSIWMRWMKASGGKNRPTRAASTASVHRPWDGDRGIMLDAVMVQPGVTANEEHVFVQPVAISDGGRRSLQGS
jgi:exopolysaccharide biosynthesis WecB/TagA/CpsF family protein